MHTLMFYLFAKTTRDASCGNIYTNHYHSMCELAEFSHTTRSIPWKNGDACDSDIGNYKHFAKSHRTVSDESWNMWTGLVDHNMPRYGSKQISLYLHRILLFLE